jgi:hypothetical protein
MIAQGGGENAPPSVSQTRHQRAKTADVLFDIDELHGGPSEVVQITSY